MVIGGTSKSFSTEKHQKYKSSDYSRSFSPKNNLSSFDIIVEEDDEEDDTKSMIYDTSRGNKVPTFQNVSMDEADIKLAAKQALQKQKEERYQNFAGLPSNGPPTHEEEVESTRKRLYEINNKDLKNVCCNALPIIRRALTHAIGMQAIERLDSHGWYYKGKNSIFCLFLFSYLTKTIFLISFVFPLVR